MNYKSLQFKILIIFTMPAIALVYFSYSLVSSKYQELETSSLHTLSAKITYTLSDFMHNIQIERGLSAGYIVLKSSLSKKTLQEQYKHTDKAYQEILTYIYNKSNHRASLYSLFGEKNKPFITKIINEFQQISSIRQKVLNSNISFKDEIGFYSEINEQILNSINIFMNFSDEKTNRDNDALYKLQHQKETMGLIRAYIYNQLLSNYNNQITINMAKELELTQEMLHREFYIHASIPSIALYNAGIDATLHNELQQMLIKFFHKKLTRDDANKWFTLSSKYINQIESISNNMLKSSLDMTKSRQDNATKSLYIVAVLWVLSLLAFLFLLYILKKLIDKEKHITDELRIASYTFDSHEAMTITDVNGTILRVNQAFTDITGYLDTEVIGKNPRVLKSDKHSAEFYKNMWHEIHTHGKWSDEIYNKRKNGEIYLERLSITAIKNDDAITTHYIAQFLDISDLKDAQILAQHQADHDFLTGLINRKALINRLGEEFSKGRRHNFVHAFLFIDLDHFKVVNDKYGHNIGDKVLIEVAKRLKSQIRTEDVLARMSGDEFVIILLNLKQNENDAAIQVKTKCEKIIHTVSQEFTIEENKINIGASIGIKIFPDSEKTTQDVIVHADTAMYQAKKSGKNRYVFFDREIELQLRQLSILEDEIHLAIENSQFEFYLQAKVNVQTELVCGAEALIRWIHPIKGTLYPDSFLQVLGNMGLIPQITKLALVSVCKFMDLNRETFTGNISININSNELLNSEFKNELLNILNLYNIPANRIELEILEDDLIEDFDTISQKILKLKELGIKFAIDDFGTGYSSITYLKKLPVNNLKIDRNFTQNLHEASNKELVKMMINMAKTFNMKSIVEGVENESQLAFIKECKADSYQGYYFSKAIPQEEFIHLLNQA